MRTLFTRSIAAALTAATIATSFPVAQANAAPANASAPVTSDFSARRRGDAGAAIALGAFALIAGAAIAASQSDNCGPYGCGYAYAPGPGPGPYYGRGQGWRHEDWHHRHWR